jgi:hypothetical protein
VVADRRHDAGRGGVLADHAPGSGLGHGLPGEGDAQVPTKVRSCGLNGEALSGKVAAAPDRQGWCRK